MKKAQVSIEFIFVIGMLFFIFLLILAFVFDKNLDVNESKKIIETKSDCTKLADLIINAFLSGNTTKIQSKLSYNATISSNSRVILVEDYVQCTLPINQVNATTLLKGDILIENKNNFIYVKNV